MKRTQVLRLRQHVMTEPQFIWDFDSNFTNYNFNKPLKSKQQSLMFTPLARYSFLTIKGFPEFIVGEIVVESPYERCLQYPQVPVRDPVYLHMTYTNNAYMHIYSI